MATISPPGIHATVMEANMHTANAIGTISRLCTTGTISGTPVLPAKSDVRPGLQYGYNKAFTGAYVSSDTFESWG